MYFINRSNKLAHSALPIARTIEINLLEMLDEKDIPPAEKPVNDEYYL